MADGKVQPARETADEGTLGRAGFLGGALGFVGLIALSVTGMAHSVQMRGAANLEFWVVVALVTAAAATVTLALARTPPRPGAGRMLAVALASLAIVLFVWEAVTTGTGFAVSPSLLLAGLLGF